MMDLAKLLPTPSRHRAALCTVAVLAGCVGPDPLETALASAEEHYLEAPGDEQAAIWYGRRLAYLGRYEEAVQIYSSALEIHPDSHRLLRHRGHRYITLRDFPAAIADLERARELIQGVPDEVEPDGQPNEFGVPRSTSHSNILYHLGLAHYLSGNCAEAEQAYRECMEFSKNDDMLCATSHWLYMTLRRAGKEEQAEEILAPIRSEMEILENHSYHRLLLFYRSVVPEPALLLDQEAIDFATTAYGLGNWHLCEGHASRAEELFRQVVEAGPSAAFGFIAAEADLDRLSNR